MAFRSVVECPQMAWKFLFNLSMGFITKIYQIPQNIFKTDIFT